MCGRGSEATGAAPLTVRVQLVGFSEWARGAAVTAIRTVVLGLRG